MFKQRGHMTGVLAATLAVIALMLPLRPPCYCQPRAAAASTEPEPLPVVPSCCCAHHAESPPACPTDAETDSGDGEGCEGCCSHSGGCSNCHEPCCLGKPTMQWSTAALDGLMTPLTAGLLPPEDSAMPSSRSLDDIFHPPRA